MTVVVTGGAGFIGSHLVRALLQRGRRVRVVDNFSTGSLDNLPANVELVEGDVNDVADEAVDGAETVFHLAANPSVSFSVDHPEASYHAAADSTGALLVASALAKTVKKFVLASSCSVYGDPEHPWPGSPYGVAKLAAEALCQEQLPIGNVSPVILRIFNAYGPGQSEKGSFVVPSFVRSALNDHPMVINDDGLQKRDFIYIDDVVKALLAAEKAPGGMPIDVGTGRETSILELAGHVAKATGYHTSANAIWRPDRRKGESRSAKADVSMMEGILGILETVPLEVGLVKTVESMRRMA